MSGPLLAAFLSLALAGCVSRVSSDKPAPPFVFRALNLSHRNSDGSLAWELKAPEARYDLERRLAQAVDLRGLIYQKGKPMYRISARSGTVLNDGELIQLEGQPRIERLSGRPTAITGQRLRWLPRKER
ncbi:MAG: LPS export ABC transporter periplasmic protein LptC, partial [Prochlorococcaceae cyanobacterium]